MLLLPNKVSATEAKGYYLSYQSKVNYPLRVLGFCKILRRILHFWPHHQPWDAGSAYRAATKYTATIFQQQKGPGLLLKPLSNVTVTLKHQQYSVTDALLRNLSKLLEYLVQCLPARNDKQRETQQQHKCQCSSASGNNSIVRRVISCDILSSVFPELK